MADPGFPRGGAPTSRGGGGANIRICQIFPKTAWNWKNLDPPGGGSLVPPPIRHWYCISIKFLLCLECIYVNVFPALHTFELCMIINVSRVYFICTSEHQNLLARAKQEVMSEQEAFGIDVITTGKWNGKTMSIISCEQIMFLFYLIYKSIFVVLQNYQFKI